MTSTQLSDLRGALQARQAELSDVLRKREVIAISSNADMMDQIQHVSERDMAIGNLERESERLREVRSALRRIDLGTYGICLDCDQDISPKRLTAVPWTATCIACTEAADRCRLSQSDAAEDTLIASI